MMRGLRKLMRAELAKGSRSRDRDGMACLLVERTSQCVGVQKKNNSKYKRDKRMMIGIRDMQGRTFNCLSDQSR